MDYAVSKNTVYRSLHSVSKGGALEDGADHLKDNSLKELIIWINGLRGIDTSAIIHHKERSLLQSTWQITGQIINAGKNIDGNFECTIYLGGKSFILRQSGEKIDILDKNIPRDVIALTVQFAELQKQLLQQLIDHHQADPTPLDLSSLLLNDVDLSGINFHHTVLGVNNLIAIIQQKGNLTGASLSENCDQRQLSKLRFNGTKMSRHLLSQLVLVQMTLSEQEMDNNEMLHGVDFSNQDLSRLPLSKVDFTGSNFTDAVLDGSNLNGATLVSTNLTNASLKRTSLIEANLADAKVSCSTNFSGSNLHGVVQINALLAEKNLTGINLSTEQVLQMANAQSKRRDFTGVVCADNSPNSDVYHQKIFANFIFNKAVLIDIHFCGADLTGASFVDANLSGAKFDENTQLVDTDLTNANLANVDLSAVKIDQSVKIKGIQLEYAKLSRAWVAAAIENNVNLEGVNLEGVDLSDFDLSQLSLKGANLKGAKLTGAKLNRSGLRAALKTRMNDQEQIDLKGIRLSGTDANHLLDLSGINFSNVDLSDGIIDYCNLDDVILTNTNLSGVNLKTSTMLTAVDADTVIVRERDCEWIENQFKQRLHTILIGGDHSGAKTDSLSSESLLSLKKAIFFPLSHDYSLTKGLTNEDGGAQDLFLSNGLDVRTYSAKLNSQERAVEEKKIKEKLLENEFSDAQKTLFHWSRGALWATLKVPYLLISEGTIDAPRCATENNLNQIYLTGRPNTTRVKTSIMAFCFNAIVDSPNFKHAFPEMTEEDKLKVAELFLSKEYKW